MNFYQNRHLIVKGQSSETGNLWLGDYESARNKRTLKADGINYIVTAGLGMKISYTGEFKHKMLPLYDCDQQDIARFFAVSYDFIDEGLQNGNVLIHCYAGVSRSTTILASYLMKKNGWGQKQTLAMIKKSRPYINPNKGFQRQLRRYESQLNNVPEEQMNMSQRVIPGKEKQFLQKMRTGNRQTFVSGVLGYQKKQRDSSIVAPKNIGLNIEKKNSTVYGNRSKTTQKYGSYNVSSNLKP